MNKTVAIYGAQLFAGTLYSVFKNLYNIQVSYFIVSEKKGNPDSIDGIKVLTLPEYLSKGIEEQIWIATPEEHHSSISRELIKSGRDNIVLLTSKMRNEILEEYYSKHKDFITLGEVKDSRIVQKEVLDLLKIYMVRSSRDKTIKQSIVLPKWIEQIQAGAELDELDMGFIKDNTGLNISHKNRSYCELTVLYWVWKNDDHQYMGLCHYRRVFGLQEKDIQKLLTLKPDVILPYPTIHFPNIKAQYKRYLTDEEFQLICDAVLTHTPEMMDLWENIWEDCYFYNYNMLFARNEIFRCYCNWLFNVLEIVDRLYIDRQINTSNRYAGYIGEILTTIYFRYHRTKLKIVHTGVDILL